MFINDIQIFASKQRKYQQNRMGVVIPKKQLVTTQNHQVNITPIETLGMPNKFNVNYRVNKLIS